MKKGFTLAEVLITLAIIGVVAALTIPTVMANYQKHAQYTAFMKVYNTLQNAVQLSIAENGSLEEFAEDSGDEDVFKKYLGNYLKTSAFCKDDLTPCISRESYSMKLLNIQDEEIQGGLDIMLLLRNPAGALLNDGSLILCSGGACFVDTNGVKEPNTLGRDIFSFDIEKINGKYNIYPTGLYDSNGNTYTLQDITGDEVDNCTTELESEGKACGARLLLEGKMKY